ncbi:MAG: GxxExxY protein [Alphaproteobacteria bacterium]|nr:GxxExxY protein [Alphaproteobacteria bacterium]
MDLETIAREIVDSAVCLHTRLGPGMLESAYEACMEYELCKRSFAVRKQVPMPLRYDDLTLDIGYRLDLVVEDAVVIEMTSVEQLLPIDTAQLLSYLRAGDYRMGFLLNFNAVHMRDGIKRVVNKL